MKIYNYKLIEDKKGKLVGKDGKRYKIVKYE